MTSYQEFMINLLVHFSINEPVPQADQCEIFVLSETTVGITHQLC